MNPKYHWYLINFTRFPYFSLALSTFSHVVTLFTVGLDTCALATDSPLKADKPKRTSFRDLRQSVFSQVGHAATMGRKSSAVIIRVHPRHWKIAISARGCTTVVQCEIKLQVGAARAAKQARRGSKKDWNEVITGRANN